MSYLEILMLCVGSAAMTVLFIPAVPLMHELTHGRLLKSHRARAGLGMLIGTPILLNYIVYRDYHLAHHRWVGTDKDPEGNHEINSRWQYIYLILVGPTIRLALELWERSKGKYPTYLRWRALPLAVFNQVAVGTWIAFVACASWTHPKVLIAVYWGPLWIATTIETLLSIPEHANSAEFAGRNVKTTRLLTTLTLGQNFHGAHHSTPHAAATMLIHSAEGGEIDLQMGYVNFHINFFRNLPWRRAT